MFFINILNLIFFNTNLTVRFSRCTGRIRPFILKITKKQVIQEKSCFSHLLSKIHVIVGIYVGFCISTIIFSTKISNLKKCMFFKPKNFEIWKFVPNRISNALKMTTNFNSFIIIKVYSNKEQYDSRNYNLKILLHEIYSK